MNFLSTQTKRASSGNICLLYYMKPLSSTDARCLGIRDEMDMMKEKVANADQMEEKLSHLQDKLKEMAELRKQYKVLQHAGFFPLVHRLMSVICCCAGITRTEQHLHAEINRA